MRAHLELSPAEKRVLTTLTVEERQALAAQMIETLAEELEWVVAVERANHAAEEAHAVVARIEAPPPPPLPPLKSLQKGARYQWPSTANAAKR